MPNRSKQKGNRTERELVRLHQALGVSAARVPLSGAVGGEFAGDLRLHLGGHAMKAECKARRNGLRQLASWLGDNDLLFIRPDREEPTVVMPWRTWTRLLAALAPADGHVK